MLEWGVITFRLLYTYKSEWKDCILITLKANYLFTLIGFFRAYLIKL